MSDLGDVGNALVRHEKVAKVMMKRSLDAGQVFTDYINRRADHPSHDLMTRILNVKIEDKSGKTRATSARGDSDLTSS